MVKVEFTGERGTVTVKVDLGGVHVTAVGPVNDLPRVFSILAEQLYGMRVDPNVIAEVARAMYGYEEELRKGRS